MNSAPETPQEVVVRPPHIIQSLLNGFNAVATHIYLIALPLALDLLLWFGPHLRVNALLTPGLKEFISLMQSNGTADMRTAVDSMGALWQTFLEQYNLVTATSTFPVGVPSLFAGLMPATNPLGAPLQVEISSMGEFFLAFVVLTLLGFLVGSLYFSLIARATGQLLSAQEPGHALIARLAPEQPDFSLGTLGWQTLQVMVMIVLLLVILLVILVPTTLISLLLSLVSPVIAQIVLLLVSFTALWMLVPLIFSPHGIFLYGQNALIAMGNSARVVRMMLPGTGMFLVACIIINQGLGMLWAIPPAGSWMALVGVLGHAFIITALLSASFVYYRSGMTYMHALQRYSVKRA